MAFESLSDKFATIIKKIKGQTRLSESNIDDMLKEIRIALLEADVNYRVVKEFTNQIKQKAIGQKVFELLNPSQTIVKIVRDELIELLGSIDSEVMFSKNGPTIIMLVGLQGSGKTTTAGKIAYLLKKKFSKRVLLVAADVYRPAAIEQLTTISKRIDVGILNMGIKISPIDISIKAKQMAIKDKYDVVVIDTAGRLQIDEKLMQELSLIQKNVSPDETLLLVDAMSGQDAVNVANSFNNQLSISGVIMSKLDGDARGGSSLSIKYLTGIPIKFAGVGEKMDDLEMFHPDRMADRILGMGDVISLIEKAQEQIDERQMKKSVNKMIDGAFTLEDMLNQMKQVQKLGSLGGIIKLLPGMPKLSEEQKDKAEQEMKNFEAIINSMTSKERRHPEILRNSRKIRISKGAGKTSADVNKVLKKFEQMKQMSKLMTQYKKTGKMPPGMGGFGL
ncbi:MAG: signal recognition particle protein [Bacilli bacterium]|jgi:signal recognition particle subunit SRP54